MIISRTPLRISFLGGGTDYPAWSNEHGGAVLSTTIDKFCWLTVRRLPPFFPHRNRIVYRVIETTAAAGEIAHPTVRAVMLHAGLEGLEIHHDADLPARSGMGTSSAFTVGLLNACHALLGHRRTKMQLAAEAIYVEQVLLKETVGSQDQVAAAFGGFNHVQFSPLHTFPVRGLVTDNAGQVTGGDIAPPAAVVEQPFRIQVAPVPLPDWRMEEFHSHLLLFFTGVSRTASEVAESFVPGLGTNPALKDAVAAVEEGLRILGDLGPIEAFGEILDSAWKKKRAISAAVSNPAIDLHYEVARAQGAIGGKLLGAGGGGFLLLFARPKDHATLVVRMKQQGLLHVPFRFEREGSAVPVYNP